MTQPPRAGAVLYAKELDRVAAFYRAVLGFAAVDRDAEHVRLEAHAFQLVVLQMPSQVAAGIELAVPPVPRADTAIKLVFVVPSISQARASAPGFGGSVKGAGSEWSFDGCTVCDGFDPEGNIFQLREAAVSGNDDHGTGA
jgi:predicted enzyme related to lactoylglutathione lyase